MSQNCKKNKIESLLYNQMGEHSCKY